jgi:FAD-linked sulfhydryl oxidase
MAAASSSNKRCKLCGDFRQWRKKQQKASVDASSESASLVGTAIPEKEEVECPPDLFDLGRCTWSFLHTMAAYYPEKPTPQQQTDMTQFMTLFGKFFPCEDCAEHFRERMNIRPPNARNRKSFTRWMCEMHNDVNRRTGKELFDCSKVDERWRDGWNDGSCD